MSDVATWSLYSNKVLLSLQSHSGHPYTSQRKKIHDFLSRISLVFIIIYPHMKNNKKVAKLCKKCCVEKVDRHLLPFVIVSTFLHTLAYFVPSVSSERCDIGHYMQGKLQLDWKAFSILWPMSLFFLLLLHVWMRNWHTCTRQDWSHEHCVMDLTLVNDDSHQRGFESLFSPLLPHIFPNSHFNPQIIYNDVQKLFLRVRFGLWKL